MTHVMALALVLRVFDGSGESAGHRRGAMQAADSILREADIAATWIDCSRDAAPAPHALCTQPLRSGELAIRIAKAPVEPAARPTGRPDKNAVVHQALGYSLVQPGVGGTLATIFSDRVAWLAASSRSSYAALLGRAVAHEIGHLLVGTTEHSSSGLMRALWTSAELMRDAHDDWLFTATDRARLHRSRVSAEQRRLAQQQADDSPDPS